MEPTGTGQTGPLTAPSPCSCPLLHPPHWLAQQVYPWHQGGGDGGVTEGLFYREPEGQQTVLATYYDVPVVSLRAAAYHLMRLGVDGFKASIWRRWAGTDEEAESACLASVFARCLPSRLLPARFAPRHKSAHTLFTCCSPTACLARCCARARRWTRCP